MPPSLPNTIRTAQINAENLFLFFDQPLPPNWRELSEKEWQKLSHASVQNKSLKKALWLAQSLLEIGADIVLVNEVGGNESLTNFAKFFLNDQYSAHIVEGNSDRGIDIGYLVKNTFPGRAELRSHKDRPLGFLYPHEQLNNEYFEKTMPEKVIKSHYFSRDCSELRVYDGDQLKLILLLVHLKSKLDPQGIDPEGRERRAAEVRSLVSIYKETRAAHPGVPTIVGGDFNGNAKRAGGEKEFAPLFEQTDLENVFQILGLDQQTSMTQIQFGRHATPYFLQIDYFFVSPELQNCVVPEGTYVYRYRSDLGVKLAIPTTLDQRLYLPSDHYPIVATFKDWTSS